MPAFITTKSVLEPETTDKTQLFELISWRQIDVIKELLEKTSCDLNEKDSHGNLATIVAAQRNDLPMIKFLVSKGASLKLENSRGRTVKWWAEKYKNNEMLNFIKKQKDTA